MWICPENNVFNLIAIVCGLGFSKLLEKLVVKYPLDKDYKERKNAGFVR